MKRKDFLCVMCDEKQEPENHDRNRGQQSTIIARNGVVLPDKQRETVTLRLYDGSIFGLETENHASHVTSFRSYDLNLEPGTAINFAVHAKTANSTKCGW